MVMKVEGGSFLFMLSMYFRNQSLINKHFPHRLRFIETFYRQKIKKTQTMQTIISNQSIKILLYRFVAHILSHSKISIKNVMS